MSVSKTATGYRKLLQPQSRGHEPDMLPTELLVGAQQISTAPLHSLPNDKILD